MIEKKEIIVFISRKKYSPRSFYFHHKTTARFTKNNGSFYTKRQLVLHKTTARFIKNNGLIYQNQRLILPKTTARFTENNGLIYYEAKQVAEAFAVISPRAHTLFYFYTSLRKAKIAQISPICAEINLIIRNKTLTLPNLLRVF